MVFLVFTSADTVTKKSSQGALRQDMTKMKWEKIVDMVPCPFCGCTEVETFPAKDERSAMVCCVNCPCGFEIDGYDIEALLEVWNVRDFPPWDGRTG